MSRESRTISVLEGDWERWGDLAWKARVSRSEYIRRAVEAYSEQEPQVRRLAGSAAVRREVAQVDAAPDEGEGVYRLTELGAALVKHSAVREPVDTTPAGWERLPLDSESTPKQRTFNPASKEHAARRPKRGRHS